MRTVTVYGRPGCHLCEDALAVVRQVAATVPLQLRVVDIEQDEALLGRYLERIPVIEIDGREAFELFVDAPSLTRALGDPSVL